MVKLQPDRPLDLMIRGGRVVDPATGFDRTMDVGIIAGRIAVIEPRIVGRVAPIRREHPPALGTQVIDATGLLVVPGMIDLHGHVYTGVSPLTCPADAACAVGGVTTIVSAGDAGANTIDGFRRLVVDHSLTRVLAFLHISTIGLSGWPVPEARDPDYLDVDAAVRAGELNRDIVVGIKVRMSKSTVGANGLIPLAKALNAAEQLGLPVMVHIGMTATPLAALLSMLREGDIVTHCFAGGINGIVENGTVIGEAFAAKNKGVLFDVGHGFGSFDYPVAERCISQGLLPDTISTDLHSLSAGASMQDLPTTMSKMLGLGMPLHEVLASVTNSPADAIHRGTELGRLRMGAVADITILELLSTESRLRDTSDNERIVSSRLVARYTIRAGHPMLGPFPHPGVAYAAPPRTSVEAGRPPGA